MCLKMIRVFIFYIAIISSANANESICPGVTSTGEGNWPIKESSFTKKAAITASNKLAQYISNGTQEIDSVVIDNDILMIRGYLLKSRVDKNILGSKEEFCGFIKHQAYVQH